METKKYETGEAWLIGDETEDEQAERLSSFMDDFFDFCSERLAYLINSGDGKLLVMIMTFNHRYI